MNRHDYADLALIPIVAIIMLVSNLVLDGRIDKVEAPTGPAPFMVGDEPATYDTAHAQLRRLPDGFAVLVGQGCEGPDPIAVAVEEDLLPRCERIDVHQVALGD